MGIRAGKKNIIYLPTNSYNSSQPSLCDTCRKLKFLNKKLNWLETKGDSLIDQFQNVMSFYIWDQHQLSLDDVTLIRLEQYHQPSLHSMVKKKKKKKKKNILFTLLFMKQVAKNEPCPVGHHTMVGSVIGRSKLQEEECKYFVLVFLFRFLLYQSKLLRYSLTFFKK